MPTGTYEVIWANSISEAIEKLQTAKKSFDIVLSKWQVQGRSGMDVLHFCQTLSPSPACVFLADHANVPTAVSAMKAGAADFLMEPLDATVLEKTLKQISSLRASNDIAVSNLASTAIIGNSPALQKALNLIRRVASTNAAVLLIGETGVGKDLFAQEIHRLSVRANKPFLAINGAALPSEMVESQLFGHERGAFTDARQRHIGYFERANGGTIFLDEIGELPPATQIKLLRVLESKSFERLGGDTTICVDVRIIAATNANLDVLVRQGIFREDLFYRINVVTIHIPPLRERIEDILPLMELFWQAHHPAPQIGEDVLAILLKYPWPGNVRELRNFCDATAALYPGEMLNFRCLENYLIPRMPPSANPIALPDRYSSSQPNIHEVLNQCGGNHSQAAKLLGISRSTLYRKLRNV
jgi:DNA-binding NtrC family response regulator